MDFITDDIRITAVKELTPPARLLMEFPLTSHIAENIYKTREQIHQILQGKDDRVVVIVGPCSIHDEKAGLDYAKQLLEKHHQYHEDLLIVMRVYFEKPRTTVGWKGLINDPYLDGSFNINEGLRRARHFLQAVNKIGLPAGTEFLDTITPQYTADLVSWGAIGARTTESQIHRELASGLSCPVGFKNGTDGNIRIAIDAVQTSAISHHFLSVTKEGQSAIVETKGNPDCHIIFRGGKTPNYATEFVQIAKQALQKVGLPTNIMIDCSHANSEKQFERQMLVAEDIAQQLAGGEMAIMGVMLESHLLPGKQDHYLGMDLTQLEYGKSITDPCLSWEDTVITLNTLAKAVRQRRKYRFFYENSH